MKRVLCIIASMNAGGAETFLMKMFRKIDRSKYRMDFCVNASENFYEKEIEELGGKLYKVPYKSDDFKGCFCGIKSVVKDNGYVYVMRINEHSLSVIDLIAAKSGGAKRLIMRSSNASSESRKTILLHKVFKFLPMTIPNVKIAPSDLAAQYTFGKKAAKNGKVTYLHNCLDIDTYKFNDVIREKYRNELNLKNNLVIGHVGRFNEQKNHKFLIEIFYEIHKKNKNTMLILVGDGKMRVDIESLVRELRIEEAVKFLGVREDIPQLLSAMDGFLFPSFYEGMPNTVIEAQTSGLPCLISDTITREAGICPIVQFKSLSMTAASWAEDMIDMIENNNSQRIEFSNIMQRAGYDISDCANKFERVIFE